MIAKNMKYFFSLLIFFPIFVQATPSQWTIIPDQSKLTFTGTQNGAPISGAFKTFTGTILIDPKDISVGSIEIIVDTNSINASYGLLKDTLITADWFDSKAFPKATFKATQFKKIGEKTYQADGTLTLHGITAPVTLTFTAEETSPGKGTVTGSTTLKRSAFKVGQGEWASTDEIKDDVKVDFNVVAVTK